MLHICVKIIFTKAEIWCVLQYTIWNCHFWNDTSDWGESKSSLFIHLFCVEQHPPKFSFSERMWQRGLASLVKVVSGWLIPLYAGIEIKWHLTLQTNPTKERFSFVFAGSWTPVTKAYLKLICIQFLNLSTCPFKRKLTTRLLSSIFCFGTSGCKWCESTWTLAYCRISL